MAKIILPAAGYGTRMNASLEGGKELMEDPITREYLIDWPLLVVRGSYHQGLVITRKNKTELNARLEVYNIPTLILEAPGKEWPDTILASKQDWEEAANIVLLPDTRFPLPFKVLNKLEKALEKSPIAFATIPLGDQDYSKFAILDGNRMSEKPDSPPGPNAKIICLFAFRASIGIGLFSGFSERGKWFSFEGIDKIPTVELAWFKDITRNGVVEGY